MNSTLRQIKFYSEIRIFEKKQDIIDILDDLRKVVDHIQKQAEYGYKFYPANHLPESGEGDNLKMYCNEITLSENVILLRLENFNMVHLGHNVMNIIDN